MVFLYIMAFNEKVRNWVSIDNEIANLRNEMRELRNTKNQLKEEIYTYAEQNELDRSVIKISDGQLKFQQTKQTSPLTLKYIKQCLTNSIGNEKQVDLILTYIKENRDFKTVYDIKRTFNK